MPRKKTKRMKWQKSDLIEVIIDRCVHDIIMSEDVQSLRSTDWRSAFKSGGSKFYIFNELVNELVLNKKETITDVSALRKVIGIRSQLIEGLRLEILYINKMSKMNDKAGIKFLQRYFVSDAVKYQLLMNREVSPLLRLEIVKSMANPTVMDRLLSSSEVSIADKIAYAQNSSDTGVTQKVIYNFLNHEGVSSQDKTQFILNVGTHHPTEKTLYKLYKLGARDIKAVFNALDTGVLFQFLLGTSLSQNDRLDIFQSLSDKLKNDLEYKGVTEKTLALLSNDTDKQTLLCDSELPLNSRLMMARHCMSPELVENMMLDRDTDFSVQDRIRFLDTCSWLTVHNALSLLEMNNLNESEVLRFLAKGTGMTVSEKIKFFQDLVCEAPPKLLTFQNHHQIKQDLMPQIRQQNTELIRHASITFDQKGVRVLIEKLKQFFGGNLYGGKTYEKQIEKFVQLKELTGFKEYSVVRYDKDMSSSRFEPAFKKGSEEEANRPLTKQVRFNEERQVKEYEIEPESKLRKL